MKLKANVETDVLVMGAGLAGITAAITAANAGVRVCITSSTQICSGSSFYPGTWGLGLIGPESRQDEQDLIETILEVGQQMADRELVKTLVTGIPEGLKYLEDMGLYLKKAHDKGEKEFIPCFDHKNRDWNGLIQEDARRVFTRRMKELGVTELPCTEVIELVCEEGKIQGAIALKKDGTPILISAGSVVIASGGMGGIFEKRLNTHDITGVGQYLTLKAGGELINLEFFQMMPGYISPAPKTIYNEKVFRYSEFQMPDQEISIFQGMDQEKVLEALEIHSAHGPYTTRLPSRLIDETIFQACLKDSRGVKTSYKKEIWEHQPEFISTYFQWLKEKKKLTIKDCVMLGIFAHASNGGIRIDSSASTGVPGLFACGEATGGMHGADRLGGLSTANGLVFGRIAGVSAAGAARSGKRLSETEFLPCSIPGAREYLKQIQAINTASAMIRREEEEIKNSLECLRRIKEEIRSNGSRSKEQAQDLAGIRDTCHVKAALHLTECLLHAILLRRESRGSHNRIDYPDVDHDMNANIVSRWDKALITQFKS